MIQIIHKASKVSVTPMSSDNALFNSKALCPTEHLCMVRAANTSALRALGVSAPSMTDEEYTFATEYQLSQLTAEEKAQVVATEQEVHARRDAIRGFTDADVAKYIADNSKEAVIADPSKNIVAVPAVVVTEAQAKAKLIKVDMLMRQPVVVPTDAVLATTITAEKEKALATSKVNALVSAGHLCTNLDALDAQGNEVHASFKAQFDVVVTTL